MKQRVRSTINFLFQDARLKPKGFTLIELLVVIGIIAVLFAVVLIAINPAKRFAEARNASRLSDVRSIVEAVSTYTVDNRGQLPLNLPTSPMCIGTGTNTHQSPLTTPGTGTLWNGLVALWRLDEGSGSAAGDSSGNGNNGIRSGAVSYKTGSECVNKNCVETTNGGNISVPYNSSLNLTTNVTYAQWIKIKTAIPASSWPYSIGNDSHKYYSFRSSSNGTRWMFEYGRDNPTCSGTSGNYTSVGSIDLGMNVWHHLIATYNGSYIKTYLDGVQINSAAFSLGFCNNSSVPYNIASGPASPGAYLVDEAAVWNRALDPVTEIPTLASKCYNLSSVLSSYLVKVPKDPSTGTDADTGYEIWKGATGTINIRAVTPDTIDGVTPTIYVSR
ncbi:prepilin-type N-terminal cleavage/methylation domain-containing protein [Patescibacteria group bacterium]|nr:MAG: prepilin-type N-terminal cleavage/methylation domain-containing protein [Patescibacteria group bacterium]